MWLRGLKYNCDIVVTMRRIWSGRASTQVKTNMTMASPVKIMGETWKAHQKKNLRVG